MFGNGDPERGQAATAHLFLSSTFHDMRAERDYLITNVYPKIEEELRAIDIAFFDVDLRWGVPDFTRVASEADPQSITNTWRYCRDQIDHSVPLFFAILGNRYGSPVAPGSLESYEYAKWGDRRSMTDLEIRHALIDCKAPRHICRFMLRELDRKELDEKSEEMFFPATEQAQQNQLRKLVAARFAFATFRYRPDFSDGQVINLDDFGRQFRDAVIDAILTDRRYLRANAIPKWLPLTRRALGLSALSPRLRSRVLARASAAISEEDREDRQIARFIRDRTQWWTGRIEELDELEKRVLADRFEAPRITILRGPQGLGKTSLLAALIQKLERSGSYSNAPQVVAHFVGATDHSSTEFDFLVRLNRSLENIELDSTRRRPLARVPGQIQTVRTLGDRARMKLEGYTGRKRLVLVLDGINQIADDVQLHWLPRTPSPNIHIVISYATNAPDSMFKAAIEGRAFKDDEFFSLKPFEQIAELTRTFLTTYRKELDESHVRKLQELELAKNPLFLTAFLRKLRAIGGQDVRGATMGSIADAGTRYTSVSDLFVDIFSQMEHDWPKEAGPFFTYLLLARRGLSSRHLAALLEAKCGPKAAEASHRIRRVFRPYLLNRAGRLDYFHSVVKEAASAKFAPSEPQTINKEIAHVFAQADLGFRVEKGLANEMIYHLFEAHDWEAALGAISDESVLDPIFLTRGGVRVLVLDAARGHQLMLDSGQVKYADELISIFLNLIQTPRFVARGLNLPNLNAWLVYNYEGRTFLRQLMEAGAQEEISLSGMARESADFARRCRGWLAGIVRRDSPPDLDRAWRLASDLLPFARPAPKLLRPFLRWLGMLRSALQSEKRTAVVRNSDLSPIIYELAQVARLRGQPEQAAKLFQGSADFAFKSGNYVGGWVSEYTSAATLCAAAMMDVGAFKKVMRDALQVFRREAAKDDPLADRSISSVLAHLFDAAVSEGDTDDARSVFCELGEHGWYAKNGYGQFDKLRLACLRTLEDDWEAAIGIFEGIVDKEERFFITPDNAEDGLAQWCFEYGRCLKGAGRSSDAIGLWNRAMALPVSAGNGLWQAKIEAALSSPATGQ